MNLAAVREIARKTYKNFNSGMRQLDTGTGLFIPTYDRITNEVWPVTAGEGPGKYGVFSTDEALSEKTVKQLKEMGFDVKRRERENPRPTGWRQKWHEIRPGTTDASKRAYEKMLLDISLAHLRQARGALLERRAQYA